MTDQSPQSQLQPATIWTWLAGVALASFGLNVLIGVVGGTPQPVVHDEFSYLLAADTFARGRLTNPSPAGAEHFESIHILVRPTYQSKYPPGPGLAMALGHPIAGQPIVGVWIVTALMSAAVTWLLARVVSIRWAASAGMMVSLHPEVMFWSHSYWGGSLAMLGGSLLLGGAMRVLSLPVDQSAPAPRARRRELLRCGLAAGGGISLLALSRPFEGLILTALTGAIVLISIVQRRHWQQFSTFSAAAAAVVLPALLFMAYYNAKVTGNALRFPYVEHEAQYGVAPLFVWQHPRPAPSHAHEAVAEYHTGWSMQWYRSQRTVSGFAWMTWLKFSDLSDAYLLHGLLPVALAGLWFWRRRRIAFLPLLLLLVCLLPMLGAVWIQPQYIAPAIPLAVLAVVIALKGLVQWRVGTRQVPLGRILVCCWITLFVVACAVATWQRVQSLWEPPPFASQRMEIVDRLRDAGEMHLVFVQYGAAKNVFEEWVYNGADIQETPIVWARDMGEERNGALIRQYPGRKAWLLRVDGRRVELKALSPA